MNSHQENMTTTIQIPEKTNKKQRTTIHVQMPLEPEVHEEIKRTLREISMPVGVSFHLGKFAAHTFKANWKAELERLKKSFEKFK
jgi:hypothetical protein